MRAQPIGAKFMLLKNTTVFREKTMNMFTRKLKATLAMALVVLGVSAWAQKYPSKVIEWVVPYPPGGGTDTVARALAQVMCARRRRVLF